MSQSVKTILFFATAFLILTGCKKKSTQELSSDAFIYSFTLRASDNAVLNQDIKGRISGDTIYLALKTGINISNLVPTITYAGAINPASNAPQNFTNTVLYTLTAENGSKKTYRTMVRFLSNSKEITSFILKKVSNPALNEDITGIISGDSILINLPTGVNPTSLVPTITHSGFSLSPLNQLVTDFTFPVSYTVTAEDGTANGYKVFAGVNRSIYITGDDGYLYAINAVNGSLLWQYYTGIKAVPTYYNGIVFVAGSNNVIYAINAANGTLKWKSTPPLGNYSLTMPAAADGKIYFAGTGYLNYPNSIYAYYASFVFTLNTETGNQEWLSTLFTNNVYMDSRLTNVTVKDNIACVYDIMNGLYVFNVTDGSLLWGNIGDMLGRTNPLIVNNIICYGNEGGIKAVDVNNGQVFWQLFGPSNAIVFSSPTVSNNIIYTVGGNGYLYAIDLSGAVKWQKALGGNNFSAPFVSNNSLYILDSYNGLNSYSIQNGNLNWKQTSFSSNPVVANNEIFISDVNYRLNCLDAATGNIKWISPVNNNFSQPLCVVDGNGNSYHITDSGEQQ